MPNFRQILLIPALFALSASAFSQESTILKQIQWVKNSNSEAYYSPNTEPNAKKGNLPIAYHQFPIPSNSDFEVELRVLKTTFLKGDNYSFSNYASNVFKVKKGIKLIAKESYGYVQVETVRKGLSGNLEYLESFELKIREQQTSTPSSNPSYKRGKKIDSKLASGDWYKISITNSGIYKIDKSFVDEHFGGNNFDSRKIAVYGYGGKDLSEEITPDRPDDLLEIPCKKFGLDDGRFDDDDFLLFYAEGPITWSPTTNGEHLRHAKHTYTDKVCYFISVNAESPKTFPLKKLTDPADLSLNSYDYVFSHHIDNYTDITKNVKTGKEWFGEEFGFNTSQTFDLPEITDILLSDSLSIRSQFAERHIGGLDAIVDVSLNGNRIYSHSINSTNGESDSPYANLNSKRIIVPILSKKLSLTFNYKKPNSQSNAWLNFFEINAKVKLKYNGQPFTIRNRDLPNAPGKVIEYSIESSKSALNIWDVSDINSQIEITGNYSNGIMKFKNKTTGENQKYVIFENSAGSSPSFVGKVRNQNLHGLPFADGFIVTHSNFKSAAEELAAFHRQQDGYTINVVDINDVYNEFSSGHQDVTAIRNMMSYFHQAATTKEQRPKYLVLFGDASYDFKNRLTENTNYVPTYQSSESTNLGTVYATDDYFSLLDDGEGKFDGDGVDIGVGRFPVQTLEDATAMVNKVKAYYESKAQRSWRNDICFVADDEDSNTHLRDTEDLANHVESNHPVYNVKKIYFDAFVQEAFGGGSRYPDVERRLNEVVEGGVLIMNYMGHGGELGWAHERVLELDDINSWKNIDRMPLLVTATCEFSRFDDPDRVSAGEQVFLNPKGGAIALLTTTRLVYTTSNKSILDGLFKNNIFSYNGYDVPTLGETIMKSKNSSSGVSVGFRKFALLGDPMLTLAYPRENVTTTHINGTPVTDSKLDTIRALSKVEIRGNVTDINGKILTDYNGIVYPTIFDKHDTLQTLQNDATSYVRKFSLQKNILYRGKATVTNGEFQFEFVVPKDISYKFGQGKISYYVENTEIDGNGYFEGFVIGGTSDSLVQDDQGPEANLYVNDLNFGFGGLTDENPTLIAIIKDDNGINTVGTSIGHELTLAIDDEEAVIVNEYYESNLDDYTSGKVTYPYKNLAEGRHSVTLIAWDVANNSTTAYTEFVVASSAKLALDHVMNYPNPFTTNTTFRFDHNKPGDILDVTVQVFSISGKIVKTLNSEVATTGSTFSDIIWDGNDDFGNRIGKGVYVYRIQVKSSDGNSAEEIEKLVLLR